MILIEKTKTKALQKISPRIFKILPKACHSPLRTTVSGKFRQVLRVQVKTLS
jgi:hypothetical protein